MAYPYLLAFAPGVEAVPAGSGLRVVGTTVGRGVTLAEPPPQTRRLLERLATADADAESLCVGGDAARLHYLLLVMEGKGLLSHILAADDVRARLDPLSPPYAFRTVATEGAFRLSRFTCLRREGAEMVVECPLGAGRVRLGTGAAAAMAGLLAAPRTTDGLAGAVAGVTAPTAAAFLELLVNAGAAFACDADGGLPEDHREALRQWEFHDLLFHARSRAGRHDQPVGGTFRFCGRIEPLPAVKPPMSERRIPLYRPDPAAEDMPFTAVLDHRRSLRRCGAGPMRAEVLGEFLYRAARVQDVMPAAPDQGMLYESSHRPCASGGATHSIDLYLAVRRVAGVEPGFYHYAPLDHVLEHLDGLAGAPERMVAMAVGAAGLAQPPDVLITLASRFARVAWKYQTIAYSVILKDAGVLIQQMYLVATALDLAPSAIGAGDPDLFAEAAGTDYYAESSVAEFILSSAP